MRPALTPLRLGAVRPSGWLRRQLRLQADGQTGRLEELWPDVGPDNAWRGGSGDAWERAPYYLDGLVPLAWVLGDAALQDRARGWIEWMLGSQQADGSFGPAGDDDWWPRMVAVKALCQFADATGDERVPPFLRRYFAFQLRELPRRPLSGWGRARGAEAVLGVLWLRDVDARDGREPDESLTELAGLILSQTTPWEHHLTDGLPEGPATAFAHEIHGPNVAMGLKLPAVRWLVDGDDAHRAASAAMHERLHARHGLVNGVASGDEWLGGREPWHGTETCQVVEHAFTLEQLVRIWGSAAHADELELVAFNALAAANDPRMRAHQYHQQPNQVLVSFAQRRWTFSGDDANVFGFEPHYGCCTANLHQGWPKFAASLWMRHDRGLTAVSYAPCTVEDDDLAFDVETAYPFEETVRIRIRRAGDAPVALRLRVPGWCAEPRIAVDGEEVPAAASDGYVVLDSAWRAGQTIELTLPMSVRLVERDRGALGVRLGPLVLAHGIPEIWRPVPDAAGLGEWEITPRRSWNFGLWPAQASHWSVHRSPVGEVPFAREAAPVRVFAHGARLPGWGLVDASAGPLPDSPVPSTAPIEDIELVPYGSSRIRIAEFPVIAPQGATTAGHEVYA